MTDEVTKWHEVARSGVTAFDEVAPTVYGIVFTIPSPRHLVELISGIADQVTKPTKGFNR